MKVIGDFDGAKLKEIMADKKMSVMDVVIAFHKRDNPISEPAVRGWTKGINPMYSNAMMLSDILGVDPKSFQ